MWCTTCINIFVWSGYSLEITLIFSEKFSEPSVVLCFPSNTAFRTCTELITDLLAKSTVVGSGRFIKEDLSIHHGNDQYHRFHYKLIPITKLLWLTNLCFRVTTRTTLPFTATPGGGKDATVIGTLVVAMGVGGKVIVVKRWPLPNGECPSLGWLLRTSPFSSLPTSCYLIYLAPGINIGAY